jgi:hypothetical protein
MSLVELPLILVFALFGVGALLGMMIPERRNPTLTAVAGSLAGKSCTQADRDNPHVFDRAARRHLSCGQIVLPYWERLAMGCYTVGSNASRPPERLRRIRARLFAHNACDVLAFIGRRPECN